MILTTRDTRPHLFSAAKLYEQLSEVCLGK
jgi:hypothetical protein